MKGGGIMSEQFDAFKQAADKALTEFAGGSDAIVKLVDEYQFVRRVEYVVSKVFVIPHFSNEVLCH